MDKCPSCDSLLYNDSLDEYDTRHPTDTTKMIHHTDIKRVCRNKACPSYLRVVDVIPQEKEIEIR